jgi:hypothetical protein
VANKKNRAFERVNREMCWICEENNADSQEHSFKSSRIKALTKEIDSKDPFMTIGEDGRLYPIQGPNSAVVKFGKTICKNCNNSFSKKFDLAYDHLIRFVENDPEYFRDKKNFNWNEIYNNTEFNQVDLARYYIKNFGCRILDAGAEVPVELRTFLHTGEKCADFSLIFFKDYDFYDNQETFGGNKLLLPYAKHGISRDHENCVKYNSEGRLMLFAAVLQDGPVGVYFEWILPEVGEPGEACSSFQSEGFIVERTKLKNQKLWNDLYRFSEPPRIAKKLSSLAQEIEQLEREQEELDSKLYMSRKMEKIKLTAKNIVLAARRSQIQKRRREIEQDIERLHNLTGIDFQNLSRQAYSLLKKG